MWQEKDIDSGQLDTPELTVQNILFIIDQIIFICVTSEMKQFKKCI